MDFAFAKGWIDTTMKLNCYKNFSYALVAVLHIILTGCNSTRSFWTYVVDDAVSRPISKRDSGTRDVPRMLSPHNIKVVYSDGSNSTEVVIPMLTSGQQVFIDHRSKQSMQGLAVQPLPMTNADRELEEEYVKAGHPIVDSAPGTSIIKTHEKIRALVAEGNLSLALQYADRLLQRYPKHVKTLQSKGSILMKIGETSAAIKAYQDAQDIEFDSRVEALIQKLEQ